MFCEKVESVRLLKDGLSSPFDTQRHIDTENRPKVVQYVFISLSEKLNLCIRHAETEENINIAQ